MCLFEHYIYKCAGDQCHNEDCYKPLCDKTHCYEQTTTKDDGMYTPCFLRSSVWIRSKCDPPKERCSTPKGWATATAARRGSGSLRTKGRWLTKRRAFVIHMLHAKAE
ncbi:hypothetical protein GGTG_05347 [Gaeumannomyces tritici R3-111a-1]|uniref:Uncharacterized protein n=1 Tax=Gaeumannomyces tritici (strain R3-111a-1) TaxID=644352 RepID=J3NVN4_GAET3|nr:hypothetical protein GGTG_05347 [Gaeumannomyces tritici R3-111a-1]EJT75412.1 hypothetical protein GGTG_05347 [Gaeumannomyces tritici R3-111a-1]